MISRFIAAFLALAALSSCTGYQLGSSKPSHLQSVRTVSVPLFENKTQEQRLAVLATNTCVDAITRDGTFRIGSNGDSDATLHASISTLNYKEIRSQRLDTLRPEELELTVVIRWTLKSPQGQILASGTSYGESRFFVDDNLQLARENAFPDAVKNATENLVSRIANGF